MKLGIAELHHHGTCDVLGARLAENVVHLGWVIFKVVEFPLVYVIVEMDELVAVVAHSVMALYHVFGGEFIEVIVESVAPIFGMFATDEGHQRFSLDVGGFCHSRNLKESRRLVNVLDHFSYVAAAVKALRKHHDEGGAE